MPILLPTPHPRFLHTSLPDLDHLHRDDPVQQFASEARARLIWGEPREDRADWWIRAGQFLRDSGEFDPGIAAAENALRIAFGSGNIADGVAAWALQTSIYMIQGKFARAQALIDQIGIFGNNDSGSEQEGIYRELCGVYLLKTKNDEPLKVEEAKACLDRALLLHRQNGDAVAEIRISYPLAHFHCALGRYNTALDIVDQALSRCAETGEWQACGSLLATAASAWADQGYRNNVAELYHLALSWCTYVGDRLGRLEALIALGRFYTYSVPGGRGAVESLTAPLQEAILEAKLLDSPIHSLFAHLELATIYKKLGETEASAYHQAAGVGIGEDMKQSRGIDHIKGREDHSDRIRLAILQGRIDQLQQGIESSADPFVTFLPVRHPDGKIIDWRTGYRNSAANGLLSSIGVAEIWMMQEIQHDFHFSGLDRAMSIAWETGQSFQDEIRIVDEQKEIWWQRCITPSENGVIVVFHNVSEAHHILELNERMEIAVGTTGIGIWEADYTSGEIVWDQRMYEIYNYPHGRFSGQLQDWYSLIHPEDRERVENEWSSVPEWESVVASEFRILQPSGEVRQISSLARLFRRPDGSPEKAIGTHWDITEQKRLQQQAIISEKLVTFGKLLSSVAHEINNPLSAIAGTAQLLQLSAENEVQKDAQTILDLCKRIEGIVVCLRALSHEGMEHREEESLNRIVESALTLFPHRLESAGIHLHRNLASEIPDVRVSTSDMERVVMNLLDNAEQALHSVEDRERHLTITTRFLPDVQMVELRVADNGPGVPEELRGRLFDPFFTTKDVGEGTGLGLYLCYAIVEEHGGSLLLADTCGQGAAFSLRLPVSPQSL